MELFHSSRDEQCRNPVGAVPAGTPVIIRFFSNAADLNVTLRVWDGEEKKLLMENKAMGVYEYTLHTPTLPVILWYDFIIQQKDGQVCYYGNAPDKLGGQGCAFQTPPPSFQITVYDPAFMPPDFLRKGVMYQIFPDRFYRTEQPKSDRTDITLHQDWNELPLVCPDARSGDNQAFDFFGGTLEGIREKLTYLEELGVTVLYLNPIFKARSNHRYDTGDYMQIDPLLGSEEDFKRLCREAKQRGIRVLLDGVFSHTGEDSLYFNRYGRYESVGAYQSKESPYYSWYTFRHFPDQYACWWNIPTLPEVNKHDPTYLEYIMGENGVARHWLRCGSSGWRLDVADELPVSFLKILRKTVRKENKDAVLLGEVWEDASHKVSYGEMRSYCLGDTVDSVMNYPLREGVIRFLTGKDSAEQLMRLIRSLQENYPVPFFYSLMNLMGSHDRARILNVLCEHEFTSVAHKDRGKMRIPPAARAVAVKRFKKMLSLFIALPGIPALFYGDEAGVEGAADPFCRAPFPWGNIDPDLYETVKNAFALRKSRPVLQTGYLDLSAEGSETLVITRYFKDGRDVFGEAQNDSPYILRITRDRYSKQSERAL